MAEIVRQETYVEELPPKTDSSSAYGGKFLVAFLCLSLSAIAVIPFYFFGRPQFGEKQWYLHMPVTHDMHLHLEQMKSFYNGLAAGEIYPRWEEDTNRGFGAATTSYYPPGVYYLTSAGYALSHNWIVALLLTHLLMMIASAAAFYLYIHQYISRKASLLAMAAYIFLPYHLLDQYQRGAMAELLGFVWMPLMLYFGDRLFRRKDLEASLQTKSQRPSAWLNIAGLAASYGGFLWSHPPTAYQFSLAFGVYLLLLTLLRKDFRGLVFSGCAIVLGVLLSAAYLYPAAAEQDLIRHEYITETWPYHSTYIFVHHLPYNSVGAFFTLLDSIWIFGAAMMLVGGGLIFAYGRRSAAEILKEQAILWLVTGCFVSFMMLKYSAFIGRHIPKIEIGVFTWRMLSISSLVVALLAGLCAHLASDTMNLEKIQRRSLTSLSLFILIGGILFSFFTVVQPMIYAPDFIPSQEHVNYATIPHDAPEDPREMPRLERAILEGRKGEIEIKQWLPQSRLLRVNLPESDTLFIRTFNFPGWTATVNGQPMAIKTGKILKEIKLELPAGEYEIKLEYLNTPIRQRGELATKAAFLILIIILIIGFVSKMFARTRFAKVSAEA